MFHLVFSAGNNDCPQEAMTNIRNKQTKKNELTTTSILSAWILPPKNGIGGKINVFFVIIYKVDFDQIVFKHCIKIYKTEMFKKHFPSCSIITKVIGFYLGS